MEDHLRTSGYSRKCRQGKLVREGDAAQGRGVRGREGSGTATQSEGSFHGIPGFLRGRSGAAALS